MAKRIDAKEKDLGEFSVKRILPHAEQRSVGPFVFFDHMGPATFPAGSGVNVRPHPHIGLATLTYLFDGSMLHQDSLGSIQEILPGDVNWMVAGKGIVHSERETMEVRSREHSLNGLQSWIVLPEDQAEIEPSFTHIPKSELPCIYREKIMMRVVVGDAFNKSSPIKIYSPMFYVDVVAEPGAIIERPNREMETAVYIQSGAVEISGQRYSAGDFVLYNVDDIELAVLDNVRLIFLGGEALATPPHMDWNFVSFDKQKIAQAKQRWLAGEFPVVPSDEEEFIPLP